jgi:arylsulfatase A-like enzyme
MMLVGLEGEPPFTLSEATQVLLLAVVTYGSFSALLGVGFGLLLHVWPKRVSQRFLLFARWYVGLMLFLYLAVWWNWRLMPGLPFTTPRSLITTGLILLASLTVGYLLVPGLVSVWSHLKRRLPWLNLWLLAGLLVGGAILVVGLSTSSSLVQARSSPPVSAGGAVGANEANVVVLTLDTTRADHLGVYGYERAHTPNLDAWAKRGTVYWQTIAQIPITNPNHASLFTSKYPQTHGVLYNGWFLDYANLTLADILAERGYTTAAFVSAFPLKTEVSGLQQGFQTYDDDFSLLDRYASLMALRIVERLAGLGLGVLERQAEAVTDSVLAWVAKDPGEPFFLWVHYFDPHTPYIPPPSYERLHPPADDGEVARQIALYDGEISYMDEQVGRVLSKLEAEGLLANTILVITADHGESLDEHDYYFDHSRYVYEPSMRVPLIIVYPPAVEAGVIIDEQVQTIDIMPTILRLLGIPLVGGLQGDLLPLSAREKSAQNAAFGQTRAQMHRPEGQKYSIRKGGWKYILSPNAGVTELYDLTADPGELNNLVSVETELAQRLEAELSEWLMQTPRVEAVRESAIDPETQEKLERLGY